MIRIFIEVSCGCVELLEIFDLLFGIFIIDGVMIFGFVFIIGLDFFFENCCYMYNEL